MIKAIIVDDEQHCINRLKDMLGQYSTDVVITGSYTDVETAVAGIKQHLPDLLFLDIEIHQQTGFDLLNQIGAPFFDIIFTTAYYQYAVKAFQFGAMNYLLKPVDADDLQEALKRIRERVSERNKAASFDLVYQNLQYLQNQSRKIAVPTASGLTLLQVQHIIHCKSEVNYTTLFIKEQPRLVVARTLKEFENLLTGYDFFRVHNSHLVNLHYVKSYHKGKGGYILLEDGTEIEVSSRRKDALLERLTML